MMKVTLRKKTIWAGSESSWGTEAWNALGHAVLWCCSSWSWLHTSQDLTFGLDVTRGECALELAGACSGDQSFEDLKSGGPSPSSHWSGSSRWQWGRKSSLHFHKIDVWITLDCMEFDLLGRVFVCLLLLFFGGVMPPDIQCFSFGSVAMPEWRTEAGVQWSAQNCAPLFVYCV